ncbi:MAG: hypothetical protein R3E09_02165 [Novosphingobium sp.]
MDVPVGLVSGTIPDRGPAIASQIADFEFLPNLEKAAAGREPNRIARAAMQYVEAASHVGRCYTPQHIGIVAQKHPPPGTSASSSPTTKPLETSK